MAPRPNQELNHGPDHSDIPVAELAEPIPVADSPSNSGKWILLGCAMFAILGCMALVLIGSLYFVSSINKDKLANQAQPPVRETAESRLVAAREAFEGSRQVLSPIEGDIEQMFSDLRVAARRQQLEDIGEFLDTDRMIIAIQRAEGLALTQEQIDLARDGIASMFRGNPLAAAMSSDLFTHLRIYHIEPIGDQSEAIVYATADFEDRTILKLRFWVINKHNRWRIFDFEYLAQGVRRTEDIAQKLAAFRNASAEQHATLNIHRMQLSELAMAVRFFEYEEAERLMETIELTDSDPLVYHRDLLMLKCRYLLETDQFEKASQSIDQLEKIIPQAPVIQEFRCVCSLGMGEYEDAIRFAKQYDQLLGRNALVLTAQGDAHTRLGQFEESIGCYRRALSADNQFVDAILGFAIVAGKEHQVELKRHFSRLDNKSDSFSFFCNSLYAEENYRPIRTFVDLFRPFQKGEPDYAFYRSLLLHMEGDDAQAVAIIQPFVNSKDVPAEDRTFFVKVYVASAMQAQPLEEVFDSIDDKTAAIIGMGEFLDTAFERKSRLQDLEQLTALYEKAVGQDLEWLYYRCLANNELDRADQTFALISKRMTEINDSADQDLFQNFLMEASVMCDRVTDGYQLIDGPQEVFVSFVRYINRYHRSDKPKHKQQFETLAKLHQAKFPNDPELVLQSALAAELQGNVQQAYEQLLPLIKNGPAKGESTPNYFWHHSARLASLAGKTIEGYNAASDKQKFFLRLEYIWQSPNSYLDQPPTPQNYDEVETIANLHQALISTDADQALQSLQISIALGRKQWLRAAKLSADENSEEYYRVIPELAQAKQLDTTAAIFKDNSPALARIFSYAFDDNNLALICKLSGWVDEQVGEVPARWFFQLVADSENANNPQAWQTIADALKAHQDQFDSYGELNWEFDQFRIEALLMAKRIDAAEKAAGAFAEKWDDPIASLAVALAKQDATNVEPLAKEAVESMGYLKDDLLKNRLIRPVLQSESAQQLLQKALAKIEDSDESP